MSGAMGFDERWETDIYGAGRHLNLYPFDIVIAFLLGRFGRVEDRQSIRVLDIGCGAGNHLWFFAREGFSASGIDGSASAIEFSRKRLAYDGLSAETVCGDFSQLPWADETFDVAIDRGSITHNRRDTVERAIREANRVLKPEGAFLSQIFSDGHSATCNGHPLGDGSFDQFKESYFADIGLTFFASRKDINQIYRPYFDIDKISKISIETEQKSEPVYEYWDIFARRLPSAA